mgnify:FL=1
MGGPSNRIRKIRREKDLSGTEVAERLGISAQYYYNIERGKRSLSAEMASKLAKIFGVTTDYLLGLNDEPQSKTSEKEKNLSSLDENVYALARNFQDLDSDTQDALLKIIETLRRR